MPDLAPDPARPVTRGGGAAGGRRRGRRAVARRSARGRSGRGRGAGTEALARLRYAALALPTARDPAPARRPATRAAAAAAARAHRGRLFQLLSGETPPHAAVAETVEAARELGHARAAGFVNAVLRRFQREREAILAAVDAIPRHGRPTRAGCRGVAARPPGAGRVHPRGRQRAPPAVAAGEPPPLDSRGGRAGARGRRLRVTRHALAPDALRVDPPADVRALPGFAEGRLSVQDPAAQLAVELLGPRSGERILDACAAPGGKACTCSSGSTAAANLRLSTSPKNASDASATASRASVSTPGSARAMPPRPAPGGTGSVRPDPARRALLRDRRDPPPPGHQAAAAGGRHPGAGPPPVRPCSRPPGSCSPRGHACCTRAVPSSGPRTRRWSGGSWLPRPGPATTPPGGPPAAAPASARGRPGLPASPGKPTPTASIMLASSRAPECW